ncbi:MAG: hypothetical protein MAG451_01236 [Anaerolineales bacterium]|nr:hypothetical protein [Anaerolineales bacterium]
MRRLWLVLCLLFTGVLLPAIEPAPALAQDDLCPRPADLDHSGLVDAQDISMAAGRWRRPLEDPRFDLDDDGDVDVVDVMLVAADWGETGPTAPRLAGDGLVWAEGSTRKIRLDEASPASTWVWDGCRIRLHAARNETEPVQLVITAGAQNLTGVNVAVSDLTHGSDTIDQTQITLYREAYHIVSQPSDPYGYGLPAGTLDQGVGPIPDALIPFEDPYGSGQPVGAPFGVSAGQNQPIWIDLAVPAGTPAGAYQGTVTVTTDQGALSLPLKLVVWNFTLPSLPSLSVNSTLDPLWTLLPQYDDISEGTPAFFDLVDKHYEALAAHRLGPMNLYREPTVTEANNQVQLDWTQADSLYTHWLDTHDLPAFYVPDVYDGDNDRYRIRDGGGAFYKQADFGDPTFVDKAKQYYAALRDDLQSRGWWDQAWAYPTDETEWVADEPLNSGLDGLQRLQEWAQLIKEVDSGYRIMASSVYPVPVGPPDRGWPDLKGLVDDWNVVVQEADLDPALWASRQALGETLSFYHNDWGDFVDYKATLHRGLGWVAYKYSAWAVAGWAVAAWIGSSAEDVVNPWVSAVMPVYGYGGGALFWPGHQIEGDGSKNVDGPLPSIRLKLAREAVDDHDYLSLLAAQTSPDYARALVRGLIPRDYWDWDPSPAEVYRLRDRIGRLLDSGEAVQFATVQGQATDAATGALLADVFVTDGESGALTDDAGRYTLTVAVPASSSVNVGFSAPRYQAANRSVAVQAGGQTTQDVALSRVAEESLMLYSFETAGELDEWEFANTQSVGRVTDHATDGSQALKAVFDDDVAGEEPYAGVGTFPTYDWSSYTALEFDVYNESDYYTYVEVGVGDAGGGWYPPQTGGAIILLPNRFRHVVIPMAAISASGVDLTRIEWLEIAPETIIEETKQWPAGPRTLYFDNMRLVRVASD